MDSNIIFKKTAEGEDAIRTRRKLEQRFLRMVLIFVDGKSTVAELRNKTGNPDQAIEALMDLQAKGFIEPLVSSDPIWDEAAQLAEEIKASADEYFSQFPPDDAKKQVQSVRVEKPSMEPFLQLPPEEPLSMVSMDDYTVFDADELPPRRSGKPEQASSAAIDPVSGKPASFLDKLSAWREAREIKALKRGARRPVSLGRILLGGLLLGILSLVAWLFVFFPDDDFRLSTERTLAKASGRSVKIGAIHLGGLQKPSLTLDEVRLLASNGDDVLRVPQIHLLPAVSSIISEKPVFRSAVLSGMTLNVESLLVLANLLDKGVLRGSGFVVEKLSFENCHIASGKLQFPVMNGEVKRSSGNKFEALLFSTPDDAFQVELKPASGKLVSFKLEGSGWRPALGSKLALDSLTLRGIADAEQIQVESMDIRVFDGVIQGNAVFRDTGSVAMKGNISFERINARKALETLGIAPALEGETSGKFLVSSVSSSWSGIFNSMDVEGGIQVRRGNLRGIDLPEAMRRSSSGPVQGGGTSFEQLTGNVKSVSGGLQFSDLLFNSGLMHSSGQLTVSKEHQITGRMNLQMRGTANQTRMQVGISGTLKSPLVQAGR